MDKLSVFFLANIAILLLSLRINIYRFFRICISTLWHELYVTRKVWVLHYSILTFLLGISFGALAIYNVVRVCWIWIYSNPKNKEENEQEILRSIQPDSSELLAEPAIQPGRQAHPEEVKQVLIRKIKLFEYLEPESIKKITSLFSEVTLKKGDEIALKTNPGLFLLTQGSADVYRDGQVGEGSNSSGFMKAMRAGDLLGDLFKLLHFVLYDNLTKYIEDYSMRIVVKSEKATFFHFPFEQFLDSKQTLIRVVLSRFQKTTFDMMFRYMQISVPFVNLEFDFANHYFDLETSDAFFKLLLQDEQQLSTREKFQAVEKDGDVKEKLVEIANCYFSLLFLSNHSSPSFPSTSTTTLNELMEVSVADYSNATVRSFAELFEFRSSPNSHGSTLIRLYPKGTTLICEGEKISGVYLVLEGTIFVESADKKRSHHLSQGRFLGIPTALVMETCSFRAAASSDTIVAVFPFDAVRLIFESARNSYVSFVRKFLRFIPQVLKVADILIDWKFYSAGQQVLNEGDLVKRIGQVIHGRLRAVSHSSKKSSMQAIHVKDYTVGESFWEIECLTNECLAADMHAVRDTEVSFVSLESIGYISSVCPHVPFIISKIVATKALLRKRSLSQQIKVVEKPFLPASNIKTISLIPATEEIPIVDFGRLFFREMQSFDSCKIISSNKVVETLGNDAFNNIGQLKLQRWLQEIEERFRIVIFIGDLHMSQWNSWIIRQSDCILLVADALCTSACRSNAVDKVLEKKSTARRELVLLHSFTYASHLSDTASQWLDSRPWLLNQHHIYFPTLPVPPDMLHKDELAPDKGILQTVRDSFSRKYPNIVSSDACQKSSPSDDVRRLCRILLGRALGLVLGGGGAKGMAHIGVIRALEECGIRPDLVGGTSMGAYIAACYAQNPTYLALYAPAKLFYGRMNSVMRRLMDITFPYVSIFTGHSFNRAIWEIFKDLRIEDLWLNFFCVSTNLTRSRLEVHQKGYLWRFVRATMSLAGYLPPLVENGDMLVDGGYLNNLPADVMQQLGAQLVIAVDVGAQTDNSPVDIGDAVSGWSILFKKLFGIKINAPSMGEIQARLTYVSGDQCNQEVLSLDNVIYLRPPVEKFTTMGFKHSVEIIETGYRYATEQIKRWLEDGTAEKLDHCMTNSLQRSVSLGKNCKNSV